MNETTPLTDAFCTQALQAGIDDALIMSLKHARRLERALAGAEEALRRVDSTAKSHPYAGNTCGELARAALAQIEELRK